MRGAVWDELGVELEALKEKKLQRSLREIARRDGCRIRSGNKTYLDFSSNNYLGLSEHPAVVSAARGALLRWGAGSGSSRLVSGSLKIHSQLESAVARFKREETALVFSSGYLANLSAVTSLVDEKDAVVVDRLNHASLIDAARLSRAKLLVYPHRDTDALAGILNRAKRFRRRLVLTDAYFSMDGDVAPLDRLAEVCRSEDAMLLVDEAHSTGVFGDEGRGLTERFGLAGRIDVAMGTLSKALGSVGGFIAGGLALKEQIVNRGRTFIYTTAPSPAASAAALSSLRLIEKNSAPRKKLWKNIAALRRGLEDLDFDLMGSEGPIVPVLLKDTGRALALRDYLASRGIWAPAIRPPTVPKGTDRVRFSVSAAHDDKDIVRLLDAMKKAKARLA